jgi:hypothetical protein
MSETPTYRFGGRQGAGLLGLERPQLVTAVAALIGALVAVLGAHDPLAGLCLVALGAVVGFVPLGGRPLVAWLSPLAGALHGRRGAVAPFSEHRLSPGRGIEGHASDISTRWQLPGCRRLVIGSIDSALGEVGVADPSGAGRARSVTFALLGPRFGLCDPETQARCVASWGQLLGSLARDAGTSRLQLTERVVPDDLSSQWRFLAGAEQAGPPARAIYRGALEALDGQVLRHEVLLTLSLGRIRRGELEPAAASHCERLANLLGAAGFTARPLSAGELAGVLRSMLDPDGAGIFDSAVAGRADALAYGPGALAPRAWRGRFGTVRTDSALHATFEATSMPRLPLGPEWAWPLVLADQPVRRRTLSLHMELVPPEQAIRRAERAVVAQESDEAIRARFGFRSGARQAQSHDAALEREAELAAGFADARFALLVSVSANDEDELEQCCRAVVAAAAQSHVELRRCYGRQPDALVSTLPLGIRRLARGAR